MKKSIIAGIFFSLLPFIGSAQSFILEDWPNRMKRFTLKYFGANFNRGNSLDSKVGVYNFAVNVPIGNKLNLVAMLPYISSSRNGLKRESGNGNIYLGVQYLLRSTSTGGFSLSAGAFLPTLPEDKPSLATTYFYTRHTHFPTSLPNVLTFSGNLAYRRFLGDNIMVGLQVGPYIAIPTIGDEQSKTEVYLHYGLFSTYRIFSQINLRTELAGVGIISQDSESSGQRFAHSLTFGVLWSRSFLRPGIFYKIYLSKSLREEIRGVFGIRLEVMFR